MKLSLHRWALALGAVGGLGCGETSTAPPEDLNRFNSQEFAWRTDSIVAEVEVVSLAPWAIGDPTVSGSSQGYQFRSHVLRRMMQQYGRDAHVREGSAVTLTVLQSTMFGRCPRPAAPFEGAPGFARPAIGGRFVVYAIPFGGTDERVILRAWRVNPSTSAAGEPGDDTIAEPVFGFPAGTPVSRVFDTSALAALAARPDSGTDANLGE